MTLQQFCGLCGTPVYVDDSTTLYNMDDSLHPHQGGSKLPRYADKMPVDLLALGV